MFREIEVRGDLEDGLLSRIAAAAATLASAGLSAEEIEDDIVDAFPELEDACMEAGPGGVGVLVVAAA